ncbi:methyl-accepting chemotaxis protein [Arcobacter sp. CECT 8985]|uniref:methyl-accepting chemotaxis protein n=1 Tax=Arcobacter sp. CECT 8985 TaxID=1935424 RepID=UPI00100BE163|nr:methyl-accepting chemotaxis protein [Arcobacter sp. CECT 8985]RXJ87846.1 chemotaxis protein [Arcobacter sp. CECT 8985]
MTSLSTNKKLLIFPIIFFSILIISAATINFFNKKANNSVEIAIKTDETIIKVLHARISFKQFVAELDEDFALIVSDEFKKLFKDVNSLKNHQNMLKKEDIETINKTLENINSYLDLYKKYSTARIDNLYSGNTTETNETQSMLEKMNNLVLFIENGLNRIHDHAIEAKKSWSFRLNIILISLAIFSFITFGLVSFFISRTIIKSINNFKKGLLSFFDYLNQNTTEVELLEQNNKDEFGQMAKIVNENIIKTKKSLEEDRVLIDEAIEVLNNFEQGDLSQRLKSNVSNPILTHLKDVINEMAENFEDNVNNVLITLDKYTNYNYLDSIDETGLKKQLLKLAQGVNNLGEATTKMLIENKSNGLTLDKSSDILLANVDTLNQSSNSVAATLEETSATLEEITTNIRSNTSNIDKMAKLSNEVTQSAKNGETLANKTSEAMIDINNQVSTINEAILVIDKIAFQTNILSLNAAVEAATAGEAGKGFAVVAQEVRNLASRSAQAAKEIKDIVENATFKANEGKNIASNMIEGYTQLNESISQTAILINDIENVSKEQLTNIEHINDAVTQIDSQTQQYAAVATETYEVSKVTDSIAKLIVKNADEKEFRNKELVTQKELNTQVTNKEE